MAWTAKLISKGTHPDNAQNILVEVELTNGTETIRAKTWGNDLTNDSIRRWVKILIANLDARDASLPTIPDINTTLDPLDPPAETAEQVFHRRLRRLLTLKQINSSDAAIVSAQATLQGQVETYIKNNPNAI